MPVRTTPRALSGPYAAIAILQTIVRKQKRRANAPAPRAQNVVRMPTVTLRPPCGAMLRTTELA
ncbi:hypothetical protein BTM_3936 [Burkholderia thailandensis 34]|nr:hypothetical protein BTL_5646 [Burkholderia thailandensis H0587]AJY32773.1 hypothetical protein BTM_3936 [Burkholderia thailandensis 34]